MKRWIIFLGRGGTVLITIGLALLLVSLIPSAQISSFGGSRHVGSKRFEPLSYHEYILTPQQGLQVTVTANDTLTVYILEVRAQTLYDWINEHVPPEPYVGYPFNVTNLEEFLEANPNSIGRQKEMREGKIEHVPTKITNATLILSNPSSDDITVEYEGSITSVVAPGTKVRNLAQWTIPIGFVLVLPWLTQLWKEKTTRREDAQT